MLSEKELYEQGVLWFKANKINIAKKYWHRAAMLGNASAMFCLGIYFLSDQYYDQVKAEFWFKKAEKSGHKNASYQLKLINENVFERRRMANLYFADQQPFNLLNGLKFKEKKFGNYEWFVICDKKDKQLLLSKYIVDIRQYHNIDESICWQNSEIRNWLNQDFFCSFSKKCQKDILEVELENKGNPQYHIDGGKNTKDKSFLLSYEELRKYMRINIKSDNDLLNPNDNDERLISVVKLTPEAIHKLKRRTKLNYYMVNGQRIGWWLRTPGAKANRAMRVNCNGAVRLHGREISGRLVGVRPALWLKK